VEAASRSVHEAAPIPLRHMVARSALETARRPESVRRERVKLTVDLLSGQSSVNAASLVAEERKLEPASAPIQSRQEEENTVRENTQKPRNAKSDRAKA